MTTVKHHKVVAALPTVLEPNAIYYVRAGSGFDQYVTNGAGLVVASPLNADVRSKLLDPSGLPVIRPSLRLDFLNYGDRLDPRITFTRASGGGRFNAQGIYEWLPANQPRIDYDPVTGECLGLLIEEQRTNLLTYSADLSNSAWTKAACTATAAAATAPDGTTTGNKLTESAASGQHYAHMTATVSITSGSQYTCSVYAKAGERKGIALSFGAPAFAILGRRGYFNLETGQVISAETGVTATIKYAGNGWYRCSIAATAITTGASIAGYLVMVSDTSGSFESREYAGDGVSGVYIWGAQFEERSFPTSYIPTTNAQVTRAADVASVNVLSPWYSASEGTVVAKHTSFKTGNTNNYLWSLRATDDASIIRVSHGWGSPTAVGGSVGSSGPVTRFNNALPMRTALAWQDGEPALFSSNNGAPVSLTPMAASLPVNPVLNIGRHSGAGLFLNGHIESIRYFPRALSSAELQAITA